MRVSKLFAALLALLIVGISCVGVVRAEEAEKTLRVLSMGNSFSVCLSRYFEKVVDSVPGCHVEWDHISIGGCSLERHWGNIAKEAAEPGYQYFKEFTYKEKVQSKPWDIISIQQASPISWRPETYEPFARNICDFFRENAPTAEVVIQQTWSYRPDSPLLTDTWKMDQNEMYDRVADAYNQLAKELNLRIIPVGYALQLARQNQPGGYQGFRVADFTYPDKPDLSRFFIGEKMDWNEDHTALVGDTIHLNRRGEYLQACVWFAILFDRDAREVTFVPEALSGEDAAFLREMAQKAVQEFVQVAK